MVEEQYNPDRTILKLLLVKKQSIKAIDKKQSIKTAENYEKIRKYLEKHGESKTSDIADYIGLSPVRTRVILNNMDDVVVIGGNRSYRLK